MKECKMKEKKTELIIRVSARISIKARFLGQDKYLIFLLQ